MPENHTNMPKKGLKDMSDMRSDSQENQTGHLKKNLSAESPDQNAFSMSPMTSLSLETHRSIPNKKKGSLQKYGLRSGSKKI